MSLKPPAWKIILLAAALGPPIGTALLLVPFGGLKWEHAWSIVVMGYGFGFVPSLLGGTLFAALRHKLGSGYWCAGLCGGAATAICATAMLQTKAWLGIMYLTGFAGVLPALGVRLLLHRWFPEGPEAT